jgi:hypothetical protein
VVSELRTRIVCLLLAGIIATPSTARAHPLHTSFAELTYAEATGTVIASVRVFADDFLRHSGWSAAGGGSALPAGQPEQLAARYLARTFGVTDARGRIVPLAWCGWKRNGNLVTICLTGKLTGGLAGARVRNAVLMDLFSDQINVLQTTYNSSRHSVLFTPGETVKQLT